jgi:hypothetical protein
VAKTSEYSDKELGLRPEDLEGLDPAIRREIRKNRSQAKQLADLTKRQQAQERELAFYRAGVPADEKGQFFTRGYKGELDPAKIKETWDKVFGTPDPSLNADGSKKTDEELEAERRIAAAGGEAGAGGGPIALEDAIKNAKTTEEVMEILRNAPPEAGVRVTDQ